MAKLGSSQTAKFRIGTAEMRVSTLDRANKQTQVDSVGLADNVVLEVSQESVDLLGGFPQVPVDTAITQQVSSLTGTLREYSGRNFNIMLGNGVQPYDTIIESQVTDDVLEGGLTVNVSTGDGSDFQVGDLVCIFPDGSPEKLGVHLIESELGDALTFDAGTPLLFDYNGSTDVIHIFQTYAQVIGGVDEVSYMSAQMVTVSRQNNTPDIASLWKVATSTGMTIDTNATDFASFEMGLKGLQPSAAEYGPGGDLEHLKNVIPNFPTGMLIAGGDVTTAP